MKEKSMNSNWKIKFRTWTSALILVFLVGFSQFANAQCNNTSPFGTATAPTVPNVPTTISTCVFWGEYSTINSVVAASLYQCSLLNGGFITIREGTPGGPVVASGPSPLTWASTVAGTYYAHWNGNASCSTASSCETATISYISPANACTNPITAGTTVSAPTAACPAQNVNLSLTGATTGTGLSYQWQSGPTSTGPWTNIALATNATLSTQVPAVTWFRCEMICAAGTPVASTPVEVTVSNFLNCYCNSNATSPADEDIFNVTFGQLNNTSACGQLAPGPGSIASQYSNFTTLPAQNYLLGFSYPLSIQIGTCGGNFGNWTKAWIDYNQNGIFEVPSEEIFSNSAFATGPNTQTATITIPTTALPGTTRMRVVNVETTVSTGVNPCGTYTWGETEDYFVTLVSPVACSGIPAAGTASSNLTSVCPSQNFTLSNVGYSLNTSINLQWQSATSATGPWTDIAGATNPSQVQSQLVNTWYRTRVVCTTGPDTVYSNAVAINTLPNLAGGTYTIGASGTYPTIAAAVQAMACGIAGPVVFNVLPNSGPYNEQITIPTIFGSSAINTVTFNFNNNVLTNAVSTANIAVLRLQNASHVTFNDMVINTTATAGSNVIGVLLQSQSNFVTFNNCTIDLTGNTGFSSACIASSGSNTLPTGTGNNANDLTVNSCILRGGAFGLSFIGAGPQATPVGANNYFIANNLIENFRNYGIYGSSMTNSIFQYNEIRRPVAFQTDAFYGIYLFNGGFGNVIEGNKIHSSNATTQGTNLVYPIWVNNLDAAVGSENKIINNALYNFRSSGTFYGIYAQGSNNLQVYHNTIALIEPTVTGTGIARGIFQTTLATNNVYRNNVIQINRGTTGASYCMAFTTTTSGITSNDNVLLNQGTTNAHTGLFGTTNFTTLSNWQTANTNAYDANSISADPQFLSYTSGALIPGNGAVNNTGAPVGVAFDILGTIRSATTPDAGAFEFSPAANDIGVTAITGLASPCPSVTDSFSVVIQNTGSSNLDFSLTPFTINWAVAGPIPASGTFTVNSGTLATAASQSFQVANNINVSVVGSYSVTANITAAWDAQALNNAASNPLTKNVIGINAFALQSTVFQGQSSNLTVQSGFLNTLLITEITLFGGGTGNNQATLPAIPGGTWSDDKLELTNIGTQPLNIGGFQLEFYGLVTGTYTFPANTVVPPNGVVSIAMGTGAENPAGLVFRSGLGFGDSWSSGTLNGIVLRNLGQILDVLATNGFAFPANSGVTTAQWSGTASSPAGVAGCGRTGVDSNTGADWVPATTTAQTIGTLNTGLAAGVNPTVSWTGPNNFTGTGVPVNTGVLNTLGQQVFTASLSANNCTYTDTARVNVVTPPTIDVGSDGLANPLANGCYTATEQVTVKVRNASLVQAINFTTDTLRVGVQVTGAVNTILTATVTNNSANGGNPLAMNAVVNIPVGTINMSNPGTYNFKTWVKVTGDGFINNDSSLVETITILPVNATALKDTICLGDSIALNFNGFSGPMSWEANTGSGWNAISSSPSIVVYPTVNTQYRAVYCVNRTTNVLNAVPISVPQPTVTNGTACLGGNGTVSATGTGGSISWFSAATGGLPLVTNNSYTATNVTAPSTFFAQSNQGANASQQIVVGANNATNTGTTYPAAYGNWFGGARQQFLFRATELQALGLSAGSISEMAFNVTALNTGGIPHQNYSISMKGTSTNSLTVQETGLTQVYGPTNVTPTVGWNTFVFTTPFQWNGVDNIVIETCFNNLTFTQNTSSTMTTNLPFNGTIYFIADNNPAVCTSTALTTSTSRPQIRIQITSGCSSTRVPATISVNPIPTVNMVDSVGICSNGTATLDAGAGFNAYSWSSGDTTQTSVVSTAGPYIVTVTDANGCSNSDTTLVTVLPSPIVDLGADTAICSNSGFQLDGGFGFAGYLWSNGSNNQFVNVNTSGSIFVNVTDFNGCSGSDTIVVTVNQAPAPLMSNVAFCPGTTHTIDPGTSSTFGYVWSNGAQTPTIGITTPGLYQVTVTDNNGCVGTASATYTHKTVTPFSLTAPANLCYNFESSLTAPAGFTNYVWFNGQTGQTVTFPAGTYAQGQLVTISVTALDTSGCEVTSSIDVRFNDCTSINEFGNNTSVMLYPNPNNGSFNLSILSSTELKNLNIEIMNTVGQIVHNEVLNGVKDLNKFIQLNDKSSGMYFLRLTSDKYQRVIKFNVR